MGLENEEEEIIQLGMTIKETAILSALSGLGVKIIVGDTESLEITINVTKEVVDTFPESAQSLAKKMITLGNVTKELVVNELAKRPAKT